VIEKYLCSTGTSSAEEYEKQKRVTVVHAKVPPWLFTALLSIN